MNVQLIEVDKTNEAQLRKMFKVYVSEMGKYLNQDERDKIVNSEDILKKYWKNNPRWPYLLLADGNVAGFCLLRYFPGEPGTFDIDQYYVSKEFRRRGIGGISLKQLVERHPGRWLIRVLKTNNTAMIFWLNAIKACVGTNYEQSDETCAMHFIRFNT